MQNFKMFRELCGDDTLKDVVIVTHMWGEVSWEIGEAQEAKLASNDLFFRPVLEKRGQFFQHDDTLGSANAILHLLVWNNPQALRIQCELVDDHMDISQTAAAEELNHELMVQEWQHDEEKQRVQVEMEVAMKQQIDMRKAQEQVEQRRMQEGILKAETVAQCQMAELQAENMRIEQEMKETAERAKVKTERIAVEYQQHLHKEAEQVKQQNQVEAVEHAALENSMRQQEDEWRRAHKAEQLHIQEEIARAEAEAQQLEDEPQ